MRVTHPHISQPRGHSTPRSGRFIQDLRRSASSLSHKARVLLDTSCSLRVWLLVSHSLLMACSLYYCFDCMSPFAQLKLKGASRERVRIQRRRIVAPKRSGLPNMSATGSEFVLSLRCERSVSSAVSYATDEPTERIRAKVQRLRIKNVLDRKQRAVSLPPQNNTATCCWTRGDEQPGHPLGTDDDLGPLDLITRSGPLNSPLSSLPPSPSHQTHHALYPARRSSPPRNKRTRLL